MPRPAYEIACELIRRLDINKELLDGGHPLTKTDMETTERLHHEWVKYGNGCLPFKVWYRHHVPRTGMR